MLKIDNISHTAIYGDEWRKARLGKITASKASLLIGEKSDKGVFSQQAISYIEGLAGEIITGKPAEEEFFNSNTDHGNAHELEGLIFAVNSIGKTLLRNEDGTTHRFIIYNDFAGCTPDALIPIYEDEKRLFDSTGEKLNVETFEIKCPAKHHRFIKLYKCNTPDELKKTSPNYFYQVITQMLFCDTLTGYFACYHPDFGDKPKTKVITFKRMEMLSEFKKLSDTLKYAQEELIKTINLFK